VVLLTARTLVAQVLCGVCSNDSNKTFLFHSIYGHQDTDWLCDAPSVF